MRLLSAFFLIFSFTAASAQQFNLPDEPSRPRINLGAKAYLYGLLPPSNGGTGTDNSAATGVQQWNAGAQSVSSALANGTTATTQSAADNSTKAATTAYVDRAAPTHGVIPTAVWSGTITPTALGINESSCNTSTGVVTFASSFAASLTASGQSVVLTGTVSSGYTTGTGYYIHIASNTTLTTWTNYTDAVNGSGASQVKCSVNNNPGWSLRWFSYTATFSAGYSTIAPLGAVPGTTTMEWDHNLTSALNSTVGLGECAANNITDTGATNRTAWIQGTFPTFTSTTLVQWNASNSMISTANSAPGTWAQQSTTAFEFQCKIWG